MAMVAGKGVRARRLDHLDDDVEGLTRLSVDGAQDVGRRDRPCGVEPIWGDRASRGRVNNLEVLLGRPADGGEGHRLTHRDLDACWDRLEGLNHVNDRARFAHTARVAQEDRVAQAYLPWREIGARDGVERPAESGSASAKW